MNPELRRNLWLELTRERVTLLAVILGFLFFVAYTSGGLADTAATAELVYYVLVILWGTRAAAQSITAEIGARTWDGQRMSALGPVALVTGKLFGASALAWAGGFACLAIIMVHTAGTKGPGAAMMELIYYGGMGLIAQSAALLASQVAVRRRLSHSRFDVFLYQCFGIVAAILVWRAWQWIEPSGWLADLLNRTDQGPIVATIYWWSMAVPSNQFYLASLLVFAAWLITANLRLMRTELQYRNLPTVFIAFLAFAIVYAAGFEPWREMGLSTASAFGARMAQAALPLGIVTYVMALSEPKDVVAYRWLGQQLGSGQLAALSSRMPGWILAYVALAVCGLTASLFLADGIPGIGGESSVLLTASSLGFVLRDCAIILAFGFSRAGRRGEYAALAVLGLLYFIMPRLAGGSLDVLFYPGAFEPNWISPVVAWLQAGTALWFAFSRRGLAGAPLSVRPEKS